MFKIIFAAFVLVIAFIGTAQAQVNPRLVGDKDVFKLEDDAEKKWKEALPRLQKNSGDYSQAWERLKARKAAMSVKWVIVNPVGDADLKRKEMYEWCSSYLGIDAPSMTAKDVAEKFARLEVRVQVCEDTALPAADKDKK